MKERIKNQEADERKLKALQRASKKQAREQDAQQKQTNRTAARKQREAEKAEKALQHACQQQARRLQIDLQLLESTQQGVFNNEITVNTAAKPFALNTTHAIHHNAHSGQSLEFVHYSAPPPPIN